MPLVISIMGFVVLMLFYMIAYNTYFADKIAVTERIKTYMPESLYDLDNMDKRSIVAPPSNIFWRKYIKKLGNSFAGSNWSQKLEHKLVQADLPFLGSEFIIIIITVMAFVMGLFLVLSGGKIMMGITGLVVGYFLPNIFVQRKMAQRIKSFNGQLADTLILIASSLRSGYSFMQAIEMVSKEMPPPMSVEFFRVLREINLGVTTDDAMEHMAGRINSEDLDLMVTAVLIQRQIGGNLAEILDNLANTIRERVKIKGHISTLTAQGRMSGFVVGLLPIALGFVIALLNPGYITPLFTQPVGQAMLLGAVVSEIVGVIIIRKVIDIKV